MSYTPFIGHLSLGVCVLMQRATPRIQKSEDNLACLRSGFLFQWHQASWFPDFWRVSCLHLPSWCKLLVLQKRTTIVALRGFWGPKLGTSRLHDKYFTH